MRFTSHLFTAGMMAFTLFMGFRPSEGGRLTMTDTAFNEANVRKVQIGNQVWMAENLNITVDSGGRRIACIVYKNEPGLADVYGRLYRWDEAVQACPPGWHLPSLEEWQTLFDYLGGIETAGGKMKAIDGWNPPNVGASNSSGFSALPAGGCNDGQFDGLGWATHFWSSTADGALARMPSLMNDKENAYVLTVGKNLTASVRYIRDSIKPGQSR